MKGLNKNFLPVSIDITNKQILILGGDNSALKKIKILLAYTNDLIIIGKNVHNQIKEMGIKYIEKEIEKDDLKGFSIIYSCTNNRSLNQEIVKWGHELGILVNIHDDPELCDFISPAVIKKENITISVSTNGEDALMSIAIRDKLNEMIKNENILEWLKY